MTTDSNGSTPTGSIAGQASEVLDQPLARDASRLAAQAIQSVETVLKGKGQAVRSAMVAILAGGHLLVDDLPGVGKTTLAQALARALGLGFSRIQFTSDLLPSDLLGAQVFDQRTATFSFRQGPVFSQVVLADEINRAPPRTQSALLEAMSERQVSVDGVSHPLPAPFLVLATQNPVEQSGTYPLPDSQLDRFMLRISMGYPDGAVERSLVSRPEGAGFLPLQRMSPALDAGKVASLQRLARQVRIHDDLADYMVRLVQATRQTRLLSVGASTRGLLALAAATRSSALLDGRDYALPDDVKSVAVAALAHRVHVAGAGHAGARKEEAERVVSAILERVEVPT